MCSWLLADYFRDVWIFFFFLILSIFRKSSCMYSAWAEQSDVVVPVSSWDMLSVSGVCVCAHEQGG